MSVFYQIAAILGVSLAGELLHKIIPYPIPAGVYGLVIMLLLLICHVINPNQIKKSANFLIESLPLLFVPATVSVINDWGTLKQVMLPFFITVVLITSAVMGITGKTVEKFEAFENNETGSE